MRLALYTLALRSLFTPPCAAGALPAPNLDIHHRARAATPTVRDGHFEQPSLQPFWQWNQLGARVSRVALPSNPQNHAYRFENVNCENEEYMTVRGHMLNVLPGVAYTLTFRYLFEQDADGVGWGVGFFPSTQCDPCTVTIPTHVRLARTVAGNTWHTWSGDFVGPDLATDGKVTIDLEAYTCGYRGATLLDDFVVKRA